MIYGKAPLFVDAAGWIALFDQYDPFYQRAFAFWHELQHQRPALVTSDYVLDEAYTLLRRGRGGLPMAVVLHNMVEESNIVDIVQIDSDLRRDGWRLFVKYDDKVLSYTDCVSFALMQQRKIFEVFTLPFVNHRYINRSHFFYVSIVNIPFLVL